MEKTSKPNNRLEKLALWYAALQRKHWVAYLVFVRLSAVWFSLILTYLGPALRLVKIEDASKTPTILGWITTAIIVFAILAGELSLKYEGVAYDSKYYERGYNILSRMSESMRNVCKTKRDTLLNHIREIKHSTGKNKAIRPIIVSDPAKQLGSIVREMQECLAVVLADGSSRIWSPDDLYISIAYEFPEEKGYGWHWATEERGLSLSELLAFNSHATGFSTFSYTVNGQRNAVFFNDKESAKNDRAYIPDDLDECDEQGKLLGSIACYTQSLKKSDSKYIRCVLTITSYSRRFVESDDAKTIENVKHNIKHLVVSEFMERIQTELCLMYLKYLHEFGM